MTAELIDDGGEMLREYRATTRSVTFEKDLAQLRKFTKLYGSMSPEMRRHARQYILDRIAKDLIERAA